MAAPTRWWWRSASAGSSCPRMIPRRRLPEAKRRRRQSRTPNRSRQTKPAAGDPTRLLLRAGTGCKPKAAAARSATNAEQEARLASPLKHGRSSARSKKPSAQRKKPSPPRRRRSASEKGSRGRRGCPPCRGSQARLSPRKRLPQAQSQGNSGPSRTSRSLPLRSNVPRSMRLLPLLVRGGPDSRKRAKVTVAGQAGPSRTDEDRRRAS
jgi:hypothetical protein